MTSPDFSTAPTRIPDPRTLDIADTRTLSTALFGRLASLEEGTSEYAYVRNTLVELNLSLVKYAAIRFAHTREPLEDVIQVGTIGLIKAINRFDVERGVSFTSFALPTINGEIKRFFRDHSWDVRVPRRLQELRIDLARACDTLEQELGRTPTTAELAAHLHLDEAEVAEGRKAANGYRAGSLDAPFDDDPALHHVQRRLGQEDRAFDTVECLVALKPLIGSLTQRDRTILSLRFVEELTQKEIGDRLGLSQMHVSRLLTRILTTLREALLAAGPAGGAATPPPATPSSRSPGRRSPSRGRGAPPRPGRDRPVLSPRTGADAVVPDCRP